MTYLGDMSERKVGEGLELSFPEGFIRRNSMNAFGCAWEDGELF